MANHYMTVVQAVYKQNKNRLFDYGTYSTKRRFEGSCVWKKLRSHLLPVARGSESDSVYRQFFWLGFSACFAFPKPAFQ